MKLEICPRDQYVINYMCCKYFSQFVGIFIFPVVLFDDKKFLILIYLKLSIFSFMDYAFVSDLRKFPMP